jgi:hypothetical protein
MRTPWIGPAVACATILVSTSACGSQGVRQPSAASTSDSATTESGTPTAPPITPQAPPVSTPSNAPTSALSSLIAMPFTMTGGDGSLVRGTLRLSARYRGSDTRLSAAWATLSSSKMPCDFDKTRDGVWFGTLELDSATPAYTPSLGLLVGDTSASQPDGSGYLSDYRLGVAYSGSSPCGGVGSGQREFQINPGWTSAKWGPVALQLVVRNLYSPAYPDGDPSLLSPNGRLYMQGWTPGTNYNWSAHSDSELFTRVTDKYGPVSYGHAIGLILPGLASS